MKLPKYDEKSDDMDAYIERFERYARSQSWSEDSWAVSLSSLLTGKGLEVYTSMSPEEASNYKALKIEVLKRYQLTEEGFRMKFRTSKPEPGETVLQYIAKLRRYFIRWIEMAKVEDTYEALCNLMVREQFINSCSTYLALFLKERAPRSIEEVTRIAEQYSEAHGGKISPNKPLWSPHPRKNMTEARPVPQSKEAADRKRPKTCFICDKPGHYAKDCRRKFASGPAIRQYTDRKVSAVCANAEIGGGPIQECTENGQLKLANGDSLPVFSGGCTIEMLGGDRNLDIQMGFVGSKEVKVLRDTGCELAAVRKELVKDEQFLQKQIVMITIDGQAKVVPTARIYVNTPYFTGELEAMVPKTLICDLILGNISGVLDKPDQRWKERHAPKTMAAVMTRSQRTKAEQPLKLLNVSVPSCDKEITVDSLKKAQKEDTSFDKLWSFAKGEQMKETKSGASYKYTVRTGVLYRVFLRDKRLTDKETLQIVVPTPFRKRVMELAHESIMQC